MKKLIILTGLLAATTMISAQTDVVTGVMRGKDYGVTQNTDRDRSQSQ